ncbi:hypothetical protein SNEBB_008816 [Seison nebaliae]|nr:hypothetical protein SNEBB_008816 [Seison nebaliae]
MVRISEDLVRKRTEHNNGEIFSLEEISLHQLYIEKIEHLDRWCRNLEILYLQSNLINKIENVSRLKKLQYLNLAMNLVEDIENLGGCESLNKLDLTLNFVGNIRESCTELSKCHALKSLYLVGNPCADYVGYRSYVIGKVPQLEKLDGEDITKSDRIKAEQDLASLELIMRKAETNQKIIREKQKETYANCPDTEEYSPETRYHASKEEERRKLEEEEKKTNSRFAKVEKKRPTRLFRNENEPLNVNEAKLDFVWADEKEHLVLYVDVYKYLDTSLIEVDVFPTYVRCRIKGKILQLTLNDEVFVEGSEVVRNSGTGRLCIRMKKCRTNDQFDGIDISKCQRKSVASSSRNESAISETEEKPIHNNIACHVTAPLDDNDAQCNDNLYNYHGDDGNDGNDDIPPLI